VREPVTVEWPSWVRATGLSWWLLASLAVGGCPSANDHPAPSPKRAASAVSDGPHTPDDATPRWAEAVRAPQEGDRSRAVIHERAVMPDRAYSGSSLIAVRRLVYRVHFLVPKTFREHRTLVRPPAGELTIDVSNDRLRARFSGPAWPVHEGSQVRLRRDTLGVYVFDGSGGRQLSPGQLALWFEGRGTPGVHASVRVRRETGRIAPGPGELVCALLAEWTNQPRDAVMRRCSNGALPPWFAFGPWRAELTAVVPMEVPASLMRGDELDPPALPPAPNLRPVLAGSEVSAIRPLAATDADLHDIASAIGTTSLRVVNQTDSRALMCAAGIPIAWIDGNSEGVVTDLKAGRHMIGALRPFGGLGLTRRPLAVPGEVTLRRPRPLDVE